MTEDKQDTELSPAAVEMLAALIAIIKTGEVDRITLHLKGNE